MIRRFSEDVELTFDIRQLLPDLVGGKHDALPRLAARRSAGPRSASTLASRCLAPVEPILAQALTSESLAAAIRSDGDKLFLATSDVAGSGAMSGRASCRVWRPLFRGAGDRVRGQV